MKKALFSWIGTFVLFILLVFIGSSFPTIPNWFSLVIFLDILAGIVAYIVFIVKVAIHSKGIKRIFYIMALSSVIVVPLLLILFLILTTGSSKTEKRNTQRVECFVDGRSIYATKEVCQSLSIKKEPQIIYQRPQIQIGAPPKFEFKQPEPQNIRCHFDSLGDWVCSKSWF